MQENLEFINCVAPGPQDVAEINLTLSVLHVEPGSLIYS